MLNKLKLRPYPSQFEKKEGDFRNVQVHEINKLIDELNNQTPVQPTSPYKTAAITLNETDMATLGSVGVELLPGVPGHFIIVEKIIIKANCSEKFLTPTGPDYLSIQGAVDSLVDMALVSVGNRVAVLSQFNLFVNAAEEAISSSSNTLGEGIILSTYQGEDFTQGVGTLNITITYEEIEA